MPNHNETSAAPASASQSRTWLLKKAIDLTKKAHEELLSAGETVSGYKVARYVLASLGTDSWEPLGIQIQEIPPLNQIFQMERRVTDFVHCFVLSRGILTLYELEVEICKNEGVNQFENLMLGPFLRYPAVTRYFSLPPDRQKPVKIVTEEVITFLGDILAEPNRSVVLLDELLTYIAKKKKVDRPEKLGVHIKDLGSFVRYIRESRRGEQAILRKVTKKFHDTTTEGKSSSDRKRASKSERMANSESSKKCAERRIKMKKHKMSTKLERELTNKEDGDPLKEESRFSSEKKKLDNRFSYISSAFNTFKGKHTRFISSDEGTDADSSDEEERNRVINVDRNNCSTCPYPSTTEELARLKLQSDPKHKRCKPRGNESSKKARKRKAIEAEKDDALPMKASKRRRLLATDSSQHLTLCREDLERFITIWKESCQMRSILEVVELMQNTYNLENKDRKRMKWLFSIYPCIGLLNVAVNAIRNGSSDSLYEVMQGIHENEAPVMSSEPSDVLIEAGPSNKDKEVVNVQNTTKVGISIGGIIKKITDYFEANNTGLQNGSVSAKNVLDCASWVSRQFSVNEFSALGHGHFTVFLQQHSALLSPKLCSILSEELDKSCSSLVSVHERQLGMLLYQAGPIKRKADLLILLRKQFPTMSFHISGNDVDKMKFIENPSGVLFSHALLPQNICGNEEKSETSSVSSSQALECLIKAPFLSDLMSWSHWEHAYAPSLGSFLDWYTSQGFIGDLACIATRDGRFIRVETSATADQFLEAVIQLSPLLAAVKLLSLLYQYRGSSSMPVCLLKVYAERGAHVLVRGSNDSSQANTSNSREIADTDSRVCAIGRFILDCLVSLPSEFWVFAAEILLSGLQSVTKDVSGVLLRECITSRQRFMLHDIGLSLGFVEWVEDYRQFILTGGAGLYKESSSEKNIFSNLNMISSVVSKAPAVMLGPFSCSVDNNVPSCDGTSGCSEVAVDEYTNSDNKAVTEASAFVENIRREEFGLDSNLSATDSGLLRKQHARLGRALHCLSQELYSQDSHLLLELVQNADDNTYHQSVEPTLVFILQESGIIVLNNELGFTAQNIKALCDVGNSTKKGSNAGYIGNKGIGFKSVFRVTDAPEIHSNGFHIKFDISEGQIGFVLPTLVPPRDVSIFSHLLPVEDDGTITLSRWNTCIVLPFRKKTDKGQTDALILSMFSDLHPSLLLFLHRIQCIKFKSTIDGAYRSMRKQYIGHGIVRVSDGNDKMSWLVVSKKLSSGMVRPDVQTTEIAMAFTLEEVALDEYQPFLVHQPVFAFLPLRNYGLKFILQGDFVLPTSREEVDSNSAWNQWLLAEYPSLFLAALASFSNLPCFKGKPGKAVSAFMSFVPLVGEVHGFFSHLPHMIITKLQTACCMILDGPGQLRLVPPCRVLRGWNEQVRLLISDALLEKSVGLGYLSKDVELSDQLARALGIRDYGPRVLYDAVSALFCKKDVPEDLLGMDWLSAWLVTLHSALLAHSSMRRFDDPHLEGDILDGLRKLPVIPLSNGSHCSVSEGHIWLSCDVSGAGIENQYVLEDFPLLYASLHTVHPLLLAALSSNKYLAHEGRADDLTEMLLKLGVRKLSAHEIIRSHILPALSESGTGSATNEDLIVEYLAYIMLHFQSSCAICPSEKADILLELRNKSVLLTNLGLVSLTSTPVHFGKEYGGAFDMKRYVGTELNWYEVNTAYLKHPSTQRLQTGSLKWRDFLKELGVTDFISVTQIQRVLPDNTSAITDWVSMELVSILSVLSTRKNRSGSIYFLEVLDKLWDENYSDKVFIGDERAGLQSSFVKSLHEVRWVASNTDEDLHYPRDLFFDCADVHSLLGLNAPYALPQVTSRSLLKDVGFKTEVSPGEALSLLTSWAKTQLPFRASVDQMSRLYNRISEGIPNSMLSLNQNFLESRFVFIPFQGSLSSEVSLGEMSSPKEVYWLDPTGCFEVTKELNLTKKSRCRPCRMLAAVYPGLHEFFVTRCGVPELPPFMNYADVLLELSNVALATKASHLVARVIIKWVKDIESRVASYDEILKLKELLHKVEYRVLPTTRGKWVSLHASFGFTCWVDNEKLIKHFDNVTSVNFVQLPELESGTNENIASFMQSLGIPAISKVVSREVVHYGLVNDVQKVCLINWALPYVQRYMYKMHPLRYVSFKELENEKLCQLKIVVAGKLHYKYSLNGVDTTSQDLFEASAILKENILYLTPSVDSHAIYLELSRLFFDGSTNLHFANFLHMITTMAQSGSSSEQIDFFLINSQNMSRVPENDSIWVLSPKLNPLMNPLPIVCHYNIPSQSKPVLSVSWPVPSAVNGTAVLSPEIDDQVKDVLIPIEVETDWIDDKDLTSTSQQEQPLSSGPDVSSSPIMQAVRPKSSVPDASANKSASTATPSTADSSSKCQVIVPADVDRNRFRRRNEENAQNLHTGRMGEIVAHKYFTEKLGSSRVKWVNELSETGLPYDIVIDEGHEETMEFVEVKATLYSKKDWFSITMREWQFACEKGDAYTIAHVIVMRPKASIIILKNLYKMILQHTLRLAVFMSGLHRDSLAEAEREV